MAIAHEQKWLDERQAAEPRRAFLHNEYLHLISYRQITLLMVRKAHNNTPSKYKGGKVVYEAESESGDELKDIRSSNRKQKKKNTAEYNDSDDDIEEVYKLGSDSKEVHFLSVYMCINLNN